MTNTSGKRFRRVLSNALSDSGLAEGLADYRELQQRWQRAAPPEFRDVSRPASLIDGSLLLLVDSGVLAARLRHQVPSLIQNLRRDPGFRELAQVKLRVQPIEVEAPKGDDTLQPRAAAAERSLTDLYSTVTDANLRARLARMLGFRRREA
ncbi:MAG: DUF721 domain-containing protein [Gammaproteobacteria bacterium]|nr:DUF721 domain-containing protein [Gammaproteobacteria bacterium]